MREAVGEVGGQANRLEQVLDLLLLQSFLELLRVNTNGECAHCYGLVFEADAAWGCVEVSVIISNFSCRENATGKVLNVQNMSARTQEMARVVKSVKSDEVAVENSLEEISPNRQDSVYFATRERRM